MFLFTIFRSVLKSAANKIKRNRKSPVLATPRSLCLIRFTASILRLSYVGIIQIRFTGRRAYLPLSLSGFITKPCKLPCIFNFDSLTQQKRGTFLRCLLLNRYRIISLRWHYPNQVHGSKGIPSSQPVRFCKTLQAPHCCYIVTLL